MTKTICDRCGEEIFSFDWQAVEFPEYYVSVSRGSSSPLEKVDLCNACKKAFKMWLHGDRNKNESDSGS